MTVPSKSYLDAVEHGFKAAVRWDACQPVGKQRAQLLKVIQSAEKLRACIERLDPSIRPAVDLALNSAFDLDDKSLSWVPRPFTFILDTEESGHRCDVSGLSKEDLFGCAHLIASIEALEKGLRLLHSDSEKKGPRRSKQSILVGLLVDAYEEEMGISASSSIGGAFYNYCDEGIRLLAGRLDDAELHHEHAWDGLEDLIRTEIKVMKLPPE